MFAGGGATGLWAAPGEVGPLHVGDLGDLGVARGVGMVCFGNFDGLGISGAWIEFEYSGGRRVRGLGSSGLIVGRVRGLGRGEGGGAASDILEVDCEERLIWGLRILEGGGEDHFVIV